MLSVRAGVIGWPVAHSRSPAIHLAAARATGVDMVYEAIAVEPGDAPRAVRRMATEGFRGLSVTMPHKSAVIVALDVLSPTAELLGAVNCIVIEGDRLTGANTDGEGFLMGLHHRTGASVAAKNVVVFGAGGAARAIVHACALAGASKVSIINRNAERADQAAALAPTATVGTHEHLHNCDLVVNATSFGMAGSTTEQGPLFALECLQPSAIVVDIVYEPLETRLLKDASELGHETVGGLPMLAGQAAGQFQRWTGIDPPLDVMMDAAAKPDPR